MIKVAVCDDEEMFRQDLKRLLEGYFSSKTKNYTIEYYALGETLLKADYAQYDIFCLDVEINGGMNGIELAKRIRQKNLRADIIFTTSHPEEAYCAFEVNTLRYLLKPIQQEALYKALDLVLRRRKERAAKVLKLNQGQRFLQLLFSDILYFETLDRKLKVHTTQKAYIVDNKINEVEKQLEEKHFFRIHKSYLINMAYVKEHDQTTITMQNGDIVYISRLRLKAFKEDFRCYLREAQNDRYS